MTPKHCVFALCILLETTVPVSAEMTVSLQASTPAAAPLGQIVMWLPEVTGDSPGTLWYRFRYRTEVGDFQMIRDFGPNSVLNWTGLDIEGRVEMEVSVWNRDTGERAESLAAYELTPIVTSGRPVITGTVHPLVMIYSAPACPAGSQMRVAFKRAEGGLEYTQYKTCRQGASMNFHLGGLRADTQYTARHEVSEIAQAGKATPPAALGTEVRFTTSSLPRPSLDYQVLQRGGASEMPVLLQSPLYDVAAATDLEGNVVWYYYGDSQSLTRAANGGTFVAFSQVRGGDASRQVVRKFDLLGMSLLETNAGAINDQLNEMGLRPITAFHHEVRELPDGKILVLAGTEAVFTDIQGAGEIDVLGDMILVLDRDLKVVWAWDAFDHLDVGRPATLGETCVPTSGGCPPFYLANKANDWLHGNAVDLMADGNLLYSARHQDWVIKIDYRNGAGNGDILWRLGKGGDFTMDSTDPNPWFSHQHDAKHVGTDGSSILLFDNGNIRGWDDPTVNSRGQLLQIDEEKRTVKLLLNVDVGSYSTALGSAQALPNGNYHFLSGFIGSAKSESVEVDPSGKVVYRIQAAAPEYRSFRMKNLYTPPD